MAPKKKQPEPESQLDEALLSKVRLPPALATTESETEGKSRVEQMELLGASEQDQFLATVDEDEEKESAEAAYKRLGVVDLTWRIRLRVIFSILFFVLGVVWLWRLDSLLRLQGWLQPLGVFALSDKVLVAVVAATSTVFAFLTVWATWLFPKNDFPAIPKAKAPTRSKPKTG